MSINLRAKLTLAPVRSAAPQGLVPEFSSCQPASSRLAPCVMFDTLTEFANALAYLPTANSRTTVAASRRQDRLTKPPGSLGRLEEIARHFAAWQETERPEVRRPATLVFAANHGVTAQAVSPFPSAVTAQMVDNFAAGGAAINAIASSVGATLRVIPLDLDNPTADITEAPAMTESELLDALNAGANALPPDADLVALGEMGIGNTTIAAALAASSFGGNGTRWAGPGTGLDDTGVRHKASVVDAALERHASASDAVERLRCLGGRELAAIAGAALAARINRTSVILDGYVTTAAIAPLFADNSAIVDHCLAGHCSAEPAHALLLGSMRLRPLLDLDMRLGEATGATLAVAVVRAALAAHNEMATFSEAGVSGGPEGDAPC